MKNLIILIVCTCLISILDIENTNATQYTWTGDSSTVWSTAGNWIPSGPPGSTDTVTIVTGNNFCRLVANTTIGRMTLTSGMLQMHGYTLTINTRASFNGGSVYGTANNALKPRGTVNIFAGTTFHVEVETIGGIIELNGSTFSDTSYFELTGSSSGAGTGGNTFNGVSQFVNNSSASFGLAGSNANTFNANVTFTNLGGQPFNICNAGKNAFNGNILVNSTNGSVNIGNTNGDTTTLASGKTISVGTTGFSSGTLLLRRFIQTGSTTQSITLTGSAVLNLINARFNGQLTISSPSTLAKDSEFNNILSLTQTGTATGVNWDGGNTFSGITTITNTGTRELRLTAPTRNTYNSDVTFITTSTGVIRPFYADTSDVKGNMTATGNEIELDAGTGSVKFTGSNFQQIAGDMILDFKKIKIEKTSGSITLDTAITVSDTLNLISGNLVTSSSYLLTMKAGSKIINASKNSFISGPVKKIGNTAFVFPTGKGSDYRALEMSAPSVSSNAYTAEYFNAGQSLGSSMDGSMKFIHNCNYWNFTRNSGSSNVTVKLNWDSAACDLFDSATVKVANWNGSTWKDLGNGGVTGNRYVGNIANSTTVVTYGYFALGYNMCFLAANAGSDQHTCMSDSTTIGALPVATNGMTSYTYNWSPSTGLSSTTAANPKANPSSTINYVVSVTDASGCTKRDTITIMPRNPDTYTWTGATSTAWEVASNWSPANVPITCDDVIIVTGSNNVVINGYAEVSDFTINSGTVNLQSNYLTITGKAFFNSGTINNGEVDVDNTDTAAFSGTHFGADVHVIAANKIFLNGSQFDGFAYLTQTGSSNTTSSGGNIFNGICAITNTGNGNIYLANSSADSIKSDVIYYMSGNGTIYPAYTKNTTITGNISLNYIPFPANGPVSFGANGGKIIFNGETPQTISSIIYGISPASQGSSSEDTLAIFKKLQMNKTSGDLTLDLSIRVTDSLILTKGNIISDTINVLSMRAGSVVTGASDSSFVSGPVKKFGNTAFVFPTGKDSTYRAMEITAPGSSTDVFSAEYFNERQELGEEIDTTIDFISQCNYWSLKRTTGNSDVYVKLHFDSALCGILDSADLRVASWNDTIWNDKGHGTMTGNRYIGSIATSSTQSTYYYFALATLGAELGSYGGFTKNMGQVLDTAGDVTSEPFYYAQGACTYHLLEDKIAFVFTASIDSTDEDSLFRMDLIFVNGNQEGVELTENNQMYYENFYLARLGATGIESVGVFESVDYTGLIDDINLNCSILNGLQLKFALDAGVSPSNLNYYFDGADSTVLDGERELKAYCPLGIVSFDSLYAWQVIDNEEITVDIALNLNDDEVSFDVGTYNEGFPLHIVMANISPILHVTYQYWSTLVEGHTATSNVDDFANDLWLDADNNVFCTGTTSSTFPYFPVGGTGQFQQNASPGEPDAFVFKFDSNRHLEWGSFYGGNNWDFGLQVAVNSTGYVYVAGTTFSGNLITCNNCTSDPLTSDDTWNGNSYDMFIIKFAPDGTYDPLLNSNVFATYFGENDTEQLLVMTIDGNDNVYLGGWTNDFATGTYDFPLVPLAGGYNQAFTVGTLGLDANEGFLVKINDDDNVVWSTAVGGWSQDAGLEGINGMTIDADNNLYVTGVTYSDAAPCTSVPCTTNVQEYFPLAGSGGASYVQDKAAVLDHDAFVMKFSSDGELEWSTLFGGSDDENTHLGTAILITAFNSGIAVSQSGNIYVTGSTNSSTYGPFPDFPQAILLGADKYNQVHFNNDPNGTCGGTQDAFIAMFSDRFELLWSTYYGGCGNDAGTGIASAINNEKVYITGFTTSSTLFPLQSLSYSYNQTALNGGTDAFILKFKDTDLIYAMWHGGTEAATVPNEGAKSIVTDADGNHVIFCGAADDWAAGSDFPYADPTPNLPPGAPNKAYFWSTFGSGGLHARPYITNLKNLCMVCGSDGQDREASIDNTATSDNTGTEQISFYPNPAHEYLTFSSQNLTTFTSISIINVFGAVVKSFNSFNKTIYIGDLSPGLYLIRIQNQLGEFETFRFVIQ